MEGKESHQVELSWLASQLQLTQKKTLSIMVSVHILGKNPGPSEVEE